MVKKTTKKAKGFSLAKLWAEAKAIVLTPKKAFQSLALTAGYGDAILKVIIYSILAVLINYIWSLLKINVIAAPVPNIISLIIVTAISAVFALFIGSAVLWLVALLCKGNKNFQASVQVSAAMAVMNPLIAVFGFSYLNLYAGILVSTLLSLFSLWLLYNAMLSALKCKPSPVKIIVIVLGILVILSNLNLLTAYKTTVNKLNNYQKQLQLYK